MVNSQILMSIRFWALCFLRAWGIANSTIRVLKGGFWSWTWDTRNSLSNWIVLRRFSLVRLYSLFTSEYAKFLFKHLALSFPFRAFCLKLTDFSRVILHDLIHLLLKLISFIYKVLALLTDLLFKLLVPTPVFLHLLHHGFRLVSLIVQLHLIPISEYFFSLFEFLDSNFDHIILLHLLLQLLPQKNILILNSLYLTAPPFSLSAVLLKVP